MFWGLPPTGRVLLITPKTTLSKLEAKKFGRLQSHKVHPPQEALQNVPEHVQEVQGEGPQQTLNLGGLVRPNPLHTSDNCFAR